LILSPGDFTDTPAISWIEFYEIVDLFKEFGSKIPFLTTFGQHDMRYRTKPNTALMALQSAIPNFHILDRLIHYPIDKQLYLHDTPKGPKQAYCTGKQTGQFIDPDHRWYGCSGSALKMYKDGMTSYGEMGGYDPIELGFLVWKIRDGIIAGCDRMVI